MVINYWRSCEGRRRSSRVGRRRRVGAVDGVMRHGATSLLSINRNRTGWGNLTSVKSQLRADGLLFGPICQFRLFVTSQVF